MLRRGRWHAALRVRAGAGVSREAHLKEFIALAKARPGRLNYDTPGVGTVGHLSTESFAHRTGINVVHVPYKGGVSQYTIELMSGYIDFASLQI